MPCCAVCHTESMDVYRQAAGIIGRVMDGTGTAKSLCLEKSVQKKKQTYAVVCETIRHLPLIEAMLTKAQFFEYFPSLLEDKATPYPRYLVCAMTYDAVIGRMGKINSRQHPACEAIVTSQPYLYDAYAVLKGQFNILPMATEEADGALPRYARSNQLNGQDHDATAARLDGVTMDDTIPWVFKFPPGTDLHAHPLVRAGHLILQDRASSLPGAVLFDAVPMGDGDAAGHRWANIGNGVILDACAAPGNKTLHAAAGLVDVTKPDLRKSLHHNIVAIERDPRRFKVLQSRLYSHTKSYPNLVKAINTDFLDIRGTSDEHRALSDSVVGVLLDPSCSSSGVVSRIDVATGDHGGSSKRPREDDDEEEEEISGGRRVEGLARLQFRLLTHALTAFPQCRRVVYSTCSTNWQEDEGVVTAGLFAANQHDDAPWKLTPIMPSTWATRGISLSSRQMASLPSLFTQLPPVAVTPADVTACIRCDPTVDGTSGFFVACFDR